LVRQVQLAHGPHDRLHVDRGGAPPDSQHGRLLYLSLGICRVTAAVGPSGPFAERNLWNIGLRPTSFWLDLGPPDHLAPLLGLFDDQLPEIGWRTREQRAAQVSKPRRQFGIGKTRIDRLAESVNDFSGRVFRSTDAIPLARLIA